jgi:hypothetical protein
MLRIVWNGWKKRRKKRRKEKVNRERETVLFFLFNLHRSQNTPRRKRSSYRRGISLERNTLILFSVLRFFADIVCSITSTSL